ncbi:hypothetical protein B0H17DRAFT_1206175 [Mycena rosella]|uniref:Secreted protein n=1 Tax=Mycena rosella TaxID=1033263 RepID=A0AAD7D5Q4_MYCRO|nr:hypothetical protein B0H17DRAFT_1206175 [Mycena rosella]
MKSSTTVFVCALSFAISALASDSNADRLLAACLRSRLGAANLVSAKRLSPSSTPFHCDTKKPSVARTSRPRAARLGRYS